MEIKEIGHIVKLEACKSTDHGFYLITPDDQEILLPNKYVPEDLKIGDYIEVFVYNDSEDRPVATTLKPKILLDSCAFLKAIDVNRFGAFMDWGMEKDLLIPFAEQGIKIVKGEDCLVYMYKDRATDRLVGSTKLNKFIKNDKVELKPGEEVDLLITGEIEIGMKAVINNKHFGMLYKNELFKPIQVGEQLKGFIQRIRPDGKIDLTLNSASLSSVEQLANRIWERLQNENGAINISDKSDPETIYKEFQVSKKAFRRAVGLLYSQRKIKINPESIIITED